MNTRPQSLLTMAMFLAWVKALTFWFILFHAYWPFALAAQDLHELNRRYA